jgi:hypothetical protein
MVGIALQVALASRVLTRAQDTTGEQSNPKRVIDPSAAATTFLADQYGHEPLLKTLRVTEARAAYFHRIAMSRNTRDDVAIPHPAMRPARTTEGEEGRN